METKWFEDKKLRFVYAKNALEEAVYFTDTMTEKEKRDVIEKLKTGDVPIPPKMGAVFWGPHTIWRVTPRGLVNVQKNVIRTPEGVIVIQNGEQNEDSIHVWLAEEIAKKVKVYGAVYFNDGITLETSMGTVRTVRHDDEYGIEFYDPNRKQLVRIYADTPESLIDYWMKVKDTHEYKYKQGVEVFFV